MQPRRPAAKSKPSRQSDALNRLLQDYLQDKRAAGASPRTVNHYKEVLEQVLLPFCAGAGITSLAELDTPHLNDLGASHLDGSRSAVGTSNLQGNGPQLHKSDQRIPLLGPKPKRAGHRARSLALDAQAGFGHPLPG